MRGLAKTPEYKYRTVNYLHIAAKWTATRSRICPSIAKGQSGNVKNEIVKKRIYGERFLYISARVKVPVSDLILGIKLRGVFKTWITKQIVGGSG